MRNTSHDPTTPAPQHCEASGHAPTALALGWPVRGAPYLAVLAFCLCVRVKRRVDPTRASRYPPLPTSWSSARCFYRDGRCGTDIPDTVARPPRCHLLVPHVSPPKVPPRLPERYHAEPTPLVMVGRPRLGTLVGERGSAVATRPTGGTLGGGVGDPQPPPPMEATKGEGVQVRVIPMPSTQHWRCFTSSRRRRGRLGGEET
jgi:hypothetical protein